MHFVYSWYLAFWISSQSKSLIIDSIPSLHFFGAILFFVCLVFIWQNVKGIQVRFVNGFDLQKLPHNIYVSLFQRKTEFWRFLVLFSRSEMCINYEPRSVFPTQCTLTSTSNGNYFPKCWMYLIELFAIILLDINFGFLFIVEKRQSSSVIKISPPYRILGGFQVCFGPSLR